MKCLKLNKKTDQSFIEDINILNSHFNQRFRYFRNAEL